jgi:alkylhydroperoxidase family enzyme
MAVVTVIAAQNTVPAPVRVAPVVEAQRTNEQRAIAAQFASSGMTNAVWTYLHYPALGQSLLTHERYVSNESTLPPRHRLLLGLRTAWLTRSDYLWAHRAAAARRAGFTADDLRRVAEAPDARWDAFEGTLIRAADELHVDAFLSDESWRVLTEGRVGQRYDINQMIDLVDTVGAYTIHAGVLNSMGRASRARRDRPPAGRHSVSTRRLTHQPAAARSNAAHSAGAAKNPTAPSVKPRTSFKRSCATHRPIAYAAPSTITSTADSTLSPRQRELLLMRIGILCRSEYEYAAHHRVGRRAGMTETDIARILSGPGNGGDPIEDALLRATDELHERELISGEDVGHVGGGARHSTTVRRADRRRRLSLDVDAHQHRRSTARRQYGGLPVSAVAPLRSSGGSGGPKLVGPEHHPARTSRRLASSLGSR